MVEAVIAASSTATTSELAGARLGTRFGRLDLSSRLAVLAVEKLGIDFESLSRDRIAICLSAKTGSLATDLEFWKGRDAAGGPSPTLFAYTLPSSAIGEIAIRHQITGPNLCLFGDDEHLLSEAKHLIASGEVDACICVSCQVLTPEVAEIVRAAEIVEAKAIFIKASGTAQ
jgi:3-oxoacyl-(acyl-carrier-protein) synthase